MQFKSSKHTVTVSLLWLTVLFLSVIPFLPPKEGESEAGNIIALIIVGLVNAFLIWTVLDTKYTIKEKQLFYTAGPIRGKIDIMKIYQLEHVTTWYVTSFLKPALGYYGLTVKYHKFNDIYISPKEKEKFIAELLKINPEIKVV